MEVQKKCKKMLFLVTELNYSTEVLLFKLSVFGVTERPVRSRMPKTIYLYHPERMTDGGVGPPIPSGTDDGWGVLARPYPSVERKKTDFWKTMEGRGGPK
jgi:hypothetical protein